MYTTVSPEERAAIRERDTRLVDCGDHRLGYVGIPTGGPAPGGRAPAGRLVWVCVDCGATAADRRFIRDVGCPPADLATFGTESEATATD